MSGVWVVCNTNSEIRLLKNPEEGSSGRKVLVHLPSGKAVTSYSKLEEILVGLGWERYSQGNSDLLQFKKSSSIDLISLPSDFSRFNSIYMYDIAIKNPNVFMVKDP